QPPLAGDGAGAKAQDRAGPAEPAAGGDRRPDAQDLSAAAAAQRADVRSAAVSFSGGRRHQYAAVGAAGLGDPARVANPSTGLWREPREVSETRQDFAIPFQECLEN